MAKKKKAAATAEDPKKEALQKVNEAKSALTAYLKKNKLKRNEDHSKDEKHGPKIAKLEKAITKAQNAYEKLKTPKKTKVAKKENAGRRTKYDYPADVVTAKDRKVYRQKMRAEAKGESKPKKSKKEAPAKGKEKAAKVSKKAKAAKATKKKTSKKPKKKDD